MKTTGPNHVKFLWDQMATIPHQTKEESRKSDHKSQRNQCTYIKKKNNQIENLLLFEVGYKLEVFDFFI